MSMTLPSLSIDYKILMLSCGWRGLYTAFFAEEQLCANILDRIMASKKAEVEGLHKKFQTGEIDMMGAIERMLTKVDDANDEARKQARRIRVKRQYEQVGIRDWLLEKWDSEAEDERNKLLKEMIYVASMETYSDDEDDEGAEEGESRDGDGEGEEDEEWEDEIDEEDNIEIKGMNGVQLGFTTSADIASEGIIASAI